jgi:hypothetical protein
MVDGVANEDRKLKPAVTFGNQHRAGIPRRSACKNIWLRRQRARPLPIFMALSASI